MQAPHSESSQPSFDPVITSRTTQEARGRLDLDGVLEAADGERRGISWHSSDGAVKRGAGRDGDGVAVRVATWLIARRMITAAIARR